MADNKLKTVCPLPWVHFSAHLDSTMRICCNTDHTGFIFDNHGKTIKLSEVESIQEYFNLDFYKNIRRKMLKGEQPNICKKCYEVENSGGQSVRQGYLSYYQHNSQFMDSLNQTSETGEMEANVQSLDFSLSNNCNLQCIMCNPDASYSIKKDFEKLGISYNKEFTEAAHTSWNDFEAVEKIIPQVAPSLQEFLTTGGEPFINKTHKKILDVLIKEKHSSNVQLNYHTNCTIRNDELFEMWNSFKSISLHFSIDAYGELNEYIRHKTNWNKLTQNVDIMLAHNKVHAEVHSCIQVLNIFNLTELYDWIATFEGKIPYLPFHIWMDQPSWLHMNILPTQLKEQALDKLKKYFKQKARITDPVYRERMKQIISYLERSIADGQDEKGYEVFQKRIRGFEAVRNQSPIESIVPELSPIFKKKKFFFF